MRLLMLDTLVGLATIVGAVPVTVAAVVFLGKTLPAYFTTPDGLRLEVTRVVGDFGYFVRVTNYSPVERHIEYFGVMPAGLRPLWPLGYAQFAVSALRGTRSNP